MEVNCNTLFNPVKKFFQPRPGGGDSPALKTAGGICLAALVTSLFIGIFGFAGYLNLSIGSSIVFTAAPIMFASPLCFFIPDLFQK